MEKKRGISVTSSVMNFPYQGYEINLIDTPGHQDFSEDTYRTLTAVDSALMLIDAANGVEAQTKKLFEVCALQKTPVMAFINKLDRDGNDAFSLLEEIEKVLGIHCVPMTWPIGMGASFKGVYVRESKEILLYERGEQNSRPHPVTALAPDDPSLTSLVGKELAESLVQEIELLDGASDPFDREAYLQGKQAPVYFGSALNNFGVEPLLQAICKIAPEPLPRAAKERMVEPSEPKFSGFVFKIQANMDPSHRDRVAFLRICSGEFKRGMKAHIVRLNKDQRLGRPTQFMAQDRSLVEQAYAGDIVGIHDPGVFKIGDTLTEGESLRYTGIPVFAPEHFVRVNLLDPLRSKQLNKALDQLSEEGAVQVFRPLFGGEAYLGVVGVLQFDVVAYRIEHEYGVKVRFSPLPYGAARWVHCEDKKEFEDFKSQQSQHLCLDQHGHPCILMEDEWRLKFFAERYPKLTYSQTSENVQ